MAKLITVYWRDIPSQVIARQGRSNEKCMLADRFQQAIDRAAMRAGKGSSDAYIAEWRRESTLCEGDLVAALQDAVTKLEASFDDAALERLVKAGGVAPAGSA